jgi:tetratricopeptide (TPR) repeat protein
MSFPRRTSTSLAIALLALSAALSLSPGEARAQTASPQEIALAKQTATEGLAAYRDGDFAKALSLFQQAKAVYPSAQVLRLEGYSLLALERWEAAAASMEAALESQVGPLSADDRKHVGEQLALATAHLATLNVASTVPGAKLSIDGREPVALPLNKPVRLVEGKHKIVVSAPEHEDLTEELTLEGGKAVERTLDPTPVKKDEPPPPPPPKPEPPPKKSGWFPMQRPIGFAVAGVGLAAGGAALATGLAAAQIRGYVASDLEIHRSNYGANCDKGDYRLCVFDRAVINHAADRANTLRDATLGLAIGAGVLAAGGVVLIIFAGDDKADAAPADKTGLARPKAAGGRVACGLFASPGLACSGTF